MILQNSHRNKLCLLTSKLWANYKDVLEWGQFTQEDAYVTKLNSLHFEELKKGQMRELVHIYLQ